MNKPNKPTSTAVKQPKPAPQHAEAEILVPLLDMGEKVYFAESVEIGITRRQAKAMLLAYDGLRADGAVVRHRNMSSARPISHPSDVIRYLLDQIADSYNLPGYDSPA